MPLVPQNEADSLRARLEHVGASRRRPSPESHRLPQLYRLALGVLSRAATASSIWTFTEDDARATLAAAGEVLARPDAADFGPQPDPADLEAFLIALQADEIVARGPNGYAINAERLPY